MIWYDVETKEPVAPGAGEDAGPPSIEGYHCPSCSEFKRLDFFEESIEVDHKEEPVLKVGFGQCPGCGSILLSTGLSPTG